MRSGASATWEPSIPAASDAPGDAELVELIENLTAEVFRYLGLTDVKDAERLQELRSAHDVLNFHGYFVLPEAGAP